MDVRAWPKSQPGAMEPMEALSSPRAWHQWLQTELLHWQAEECHYSVENAALAQEQFELANSERSCHETKVTKENEAMQLEMDWCNELIGELVRIHQSRSLDKARVQCQAKQLQSALEDAKGAWKKAAEQAAAVRWAVLVFRSWEKAREAWEEEAAAWVAKGSKCIAEVEHCGWGLQEGARKLIDALRLPWAEPQRESSKADEVRRILRKAREAEAKLHKEKNAVIITKDAIWACQQQDAAASIRLLRQQHIQLHSEEATLEEQVQRLRQINSAQGDDVGWEAAMEERAAAQSAENIAEAGQQQLEDRLRIGRNRLGERRALITQMLAERAREEEEHADCHRRLEADFHSEVRNAEQASVAARSLISRREEIREECNELQRQRQLQISEAKVFQGRRDEILKETAAEKEFGRAWETKLRQAASETRELRKALEEEELICKERVDALDKRRKRFSSEWSGLQRAIAVASSLSNVSSQGEIQGSEGPSLRESRPSPQLRGSQAQLSTAEGLRLEISCQVSEMKAELKRLQQTPDAGGGSSNSIVQPEAAQLRQWRLQQERKAALRLQGMVRRFGEKASVMDSLDVSGESDGQHGSTSEKERVDDDQEVLLEAQEGVLQEKRDPLMIDIQRPTREEETPSISEFLRMKAQETRVAIRSGEIHAAQLALATAKNASEFAVSFPG